MKSDRFTYELNLDRETYVLFDNGTEVYSDGSESNVRALCEDFNDDPAYAARTLANLNA